MFGENTEKIELKKNTEKQIERELLNEANKAMFDHADKDKGPDNMGPNNYGPQTPPQSVPIPQEIPRAVMGGINFLVYEKRIQRLHKEHQDDARKVIKPTEKQVQLTGDLITWVSDRYMPSLIENPWFVPATMALEIGRIEFMKFQAFKAVEEASKGGQDA